MTERSQLDLKSLYNHFIIRGFVVGHNINTIDDKYVIECVRL